MFSLLCKMGQDDLPALLLWGPDQVTDRNPFLSLMFHLKISFCIYIYCERKCTRIIQDSNGDMVESQLRFLG